MRSWWVALWLVSSLRVAPTGAGDLAQVTAPPLQFSGAGELPADATRWLRDELGVHPGTSWRVRTSPLAHGGRLVLLEERWLGVSVSNARLVLRLTEEGRVRQVIGTSLSPDARLPTPEEGRRAIERALRQGRGELRVSQLRWWADDGPVRLARLEDEPIRWARGRPVQERRILDLSGRVLASESLIDEIDVDIVGWPENPLTSPETVTYTVSLLDQDPLVLEDDIMRVFDCAWSEELENCEPVFFPTVALGEPFPDQPPSLEDTAAHSDPADPYAALQFMQFGARFEAKLADWEWDSYVWDQLDCEWQEVEPEQCRLIVHTNVLAQDELGVFRFPGGYYSRTSGIFMGQGDNTDLSYDGDVSVHEFGHHVTNGMGSPDPTSIVDDGGRRRVDRGGINEGTSDFFAMLMGQTDRTYDYYSIVEPGQYNGERIRDVSIPFRCPENIVGEVHMEGRWWAWALVASHRRLVELGLGTEDDFPRIFIAALPAIRHIPVEQRDQFADASAILIDEVLLTLGEEAAAEVEQIFADAGLLECEHVWRLEEDPWLTGAHDPEDPLTARFMALTSYNQDAEPEMVDEHPYAPPVQHRVTLADDEGGVRLRYRPGYWRPDRPVDTVELTVGALVKLGDDGVTFVRDDENVVHNDGELEFLSEPDPDPDASEGEQWDMLTIDGLTPGESYSIALVSKSPHPGELYVMQDMRWERLPIPDDGGTSGTGGDGTGGDAGASDEEDGCACRARPGEAPPLLLGIGLGLAWWRRRRSSAP